MLVGSSTDVPGIAIARGVRGLAARSVKTTSVRTKNSLKSKPERPWEGFGFKFFCSVQAQDFQRDTQIGVAGFGYKELQRHV